MNRMQTLLCTACPAMLLAGAALFAPGDAMAAGPYLERFTTVETVASTVPANGDVNPYGIAIVPRSTGALRRGHLLVSNFNDGANLQGTGTTIVQVGPDGTMTLFARLDAPWLAHACPGGIGLTTALAVFESGWVVVGSLPSPTGLSADARAGCLLVLDDEGRVAEVLAGDGINGPWDMTARDDGDHGTLFVSNVLNGNVTAGSPHVVMQGTVIRIALSLPEAHEGVPRREATTVVADSLAETADPAALVIGPTGLALDWDGTLFLADSVGNRIVAIAHATTRASPAHGGSVVSQGGALNDPLGLALAPNGDLLATNGGDGNLVEVTPDGRQVALRTIDTATGAGSLFGLVVAPHAQGVYFVDDGDNTLKRLVP